MTREQAKEFLKTLGITEPSDEQVTSYLNSFSGEIAKEKDKLSKYKEDSEKLKKAEEELEKIRNDGLSELELAKKELLKAQEEMAGLKKQNILSSIKAELNKTGLDEESYKDFVEGFIGDDLESSIARASAFVKVIEKTKTDTDTRLRKELLENTPGAGGSNGGEQETKSEAEKYVEKMAKPSNFSESIKGYF